MGEDSSVAVKVDIGPKMLARITGHGKQTGRVVDVPVWAGAWRQQGMRHVWEATSIHCGWILPGYKERSDQGKPGKEAQFP